VLTISKTTGRRDVYWIFEPESSEEETEGEDPSNPNGGGPVWTGGVAVAGAPIIFGGTGGGGGDFDDAPPLVSTGGRPGRAGMGGPFLGDATGDTTGLGEVPAVSG
jgi:hypothetical protein